MSCQSQRTTTTAQATQVDEIGTAHRIGRSGAAAPSTHPTASGPCQRRGIGIPEDDVQRIFEPYYRSGFSDTETRRGAGLGLTLVNQIVQRHGGRIDVQSTVGLGSTFTILLPKQQKIAEPMPVEAFEASKA